MCGICGYIDYECGIAEKTVDRMVESIRHRGPDDHGTAVVDTPHGRVALGHSRLSIQDLSPAGRQPMTFGSLTIVYNGEIYNFGAIRSELAAKGHHFVSESDTEVILHAFQEAGGGNCVHQFIGMFAFAIFDNKEQKLYLCRDRAGVKPLYYHIGRDFFAFGSELKALMAIPRFERRVSDKALSDFLKMGYIPGETAIFEQTYKLDAGCWATVDLRRRSVTTQKYWDIEDFYAKPKLTCTFEEAKTHLRQLFKSAFGYRLVADVPVGVLLSGGFDSTAVAAILTKELGITPRTFTIGFRNYIDEAPDAEAISRILGTAHTTQYCTHDDVKTLVPRLPEVYDEPFADTSALPSLLVSMLVRQHMPVVLSADGGDEVFAGYGGYDRICRLYPKIAQIPPFVRHHFHTPYQVAKALLPPSMGRCHVFLDQLDGAFSEGVLSQKAWYDNRWMWIQHVVDSIAPRLAGYDYRAAYRPCHAASHSPEYALLSDWKTQMKDEYLVKVDRAMMSVGLEGREPMLDHRIAEFVAQLPWEYKYKDGTRKRILRDIVYDYLPKALMDKPKRGFSPPVMQWMRTDLKDYVYDSLSDDQLRQTGFQPRKVKRLLDSFMAGNHHLYNIMWRLVQYENWYRRWIKTNA